MAQPLDNTKIDKAGLADEVSELLKGRMCCPAIVRYITLRYGDVAKGITPHDVENFKRRRVRKEEILPAAAIREELEKRSAVVDVVSTRAQLIDLQIERIEKTIENEKAMEIALQITGKSRLPGEIRLLNELLDAHKRDLADLGILGQASTGQPPSVNFTQNVICAMKVEESLIAGGMDAHRARLHILRGAFGAERLGEEQPIDVCAASLDDQRSTLDVFGSSIPVAAIRYGGTGDGGEESGADGDKRVPNS